MTGFGYTSLLGNMNDQDSFKDINLTQQENNPNNFTNDAFGLSRSNTLLSGLNNQNNNTSLHNYINNPATNFNNHNNYVDNVEQLLYPIGPTSPEAASGSQRTHEYNLDLTSTHNNQIPFNNSYSPNSLNPFNPSNWLTQKNTPVNFLSNKPENQKTLNENTIAELFKIEADLILIKGDNLTEEEFKNILLFKGGHTLEFLLGITREVSAKINGIENIIRGLQSAIDNPSSHVEKGQADRLIIISKQIETNRKLLQKNTNEKEKLREATLKILFKKPSEEELLEKLNIIYPGNIKQNTETAKYLYLAYEGIDQTARQKESASTIQSAFPNRSAGADNFLQKSNNLEVAKPEIDKTFREENQPIIISDKDKLESRSSDLDIINISARSPQLIEEENFYNEITVRPGFMHIELLNLLLTNNKSTIKSIEILIKNLKSSSDLKTFKNQIKGNASQQTITDIYKKILKRYKENELPMMGMHIEELKNIFDIKRSSTGKDKDFKNKIIICFKAPKKFKKIKQKNRFEDFIKITNPSDTLPKKINLIFSSFTQKIKKIISYEETLNMDLTKTSRYAEKIFTQEIYSIKGIKENINLFFKEMENKKEGGEILSFTETAKALMKDKKIAKSVEDYIRDSEFMRLTILENYEIARKEISVSEHQVNDFILDCFTEMVNKISDDNKFF